MRREFREHWWHYVLQSALAAVTLLAALWVFSLERAAIVASLGATSFIVFAMPRSLTAKARNVIGGHTVGATCGLLCKLVLGWLSAGGSAYALMAYAGAVGLSIFGMVVTDTEHPPASGTALGIAVLRGGVAEAWAPALAVLLGAVLLATTRRVLSPILRDLV
jgi:CBS-domain-containing membrane protein